MRLDEDDEEVAVLLVDCGELPSLPSMLVLMTFLDPLPQLTSSLSVTGLVPGIGCPVLSLVDLSPPSSSVITVRRLSSAIDC